MQYIDFKYDNRYLSDLGFIICDFNSTNDAREVDIGSEITFNKISHRSGERFTISNAEFEKCIEASFDICKNPDAFDKEDMEVTYDEYREIMTWLNRRSYFEFSFIDDNNDNNICYNASFNIQKITINDRLFGFRLHMDTDSSFAHGKEIEENFSCVGSNDHKEIYCDSDELGFLYPIVEIDCLANGNLTLLNETDNETTYIKNVKTGEKIVIDCFYQTITTTSPSHKIFNDFNYVFFHLTSKECTRFSASLKCNLVIRYAPVIKATL